MELCGWRPYQGKLPA